MTIVSPPVQPSPPEASQWVVPSPPKKPHRFRTGLLIGAGIGTGLIVIVIVISLIAYLGTVGSDTLVKSDFNSGHGPFVAESDPAVSLQYVDRGYRMLVKQTPPPQVARSMFADQSVHAFRAEIDATVRAAPAEYYIGVAAWSGSADYILLTSSLGGAALVKETDATTGAKKILTSTEQNGVAKHVHFVLEVRGGGDKPTTLVGQVNGTTVRATDPNGWDSFNGFGLMVFGTRGPVDVLWDNVNVVRIAQ